jgi:hypothetical protein
MFSPFSSCSEILLDWPTAGELIYFVAYFFHGDSTMVTNSSISTIEFLDFVYKSQLRTIVSMQSRDSQPNYGGSFFVKLSSSHLFGISWNMIY